MQDVEQASFYQEGTQPSLATRAITKEIETARGEQLKNQVIQMLQQGDYVKLNKNLTS